MQKKVTLFRRSIEFFSGEDIEMAMRRSRQMFSASQT